LDAKTIPGSRLAPLRDTAKRTERSPSPGRLGAVRAGSARSPDGAPSLVSQESLERPPWFRLSLDRLDVPDEAVDQLAGRGLRLDVRTLVDPEFVAPDGHRASPVRDDDGTPVDHVAYVRGRERAPVTLGEPREIGHEHVQCWRDRAVAPPLRAMARRAEPIEQLCAGVVGQIERLSRCADR